MLWYRFHIGTIINTINTIDIAGIAGIFGIIGIGIIIRYNKKRRFDTQYVVVTHIANLLQNNRL